jgi:transposase
VPVGLEDGSPFSVNIMALAIYLRFTHAISYRRLTQVFQHLYALHISEGALDVHVVRNSRAASVITEVMAGHRPVIWVSDLYGAQQGHADLWQICLAHQLRDCQ